MAGLSAIFLTDSEGADFEGSCDSDCLLGSFCLPVLPIKGEIFVSYLGFYQPYRGLFCAEEGEVETIRHQIQWTFYLHAGGF